MGGKEKDLEDEAIAAGDNICVANNSWKSYD